MSFVITVNDAFKIARHFGAERTEIDMDHHENRDDESGKDMQKVGDVKSAETHNQGRDRFREEQRPSGDKNQGNEQIHEKNVGELLQGIEFFLLRNGERGLLSLVNSKHVVFELADQSAKNSPVSNLIIFAVFREQVPEEEKEVIHR
jgi:hypothetical protein